MLSYYDELYKQEKNYCKNDLNTSIRSGRYPWGSYIIYARKDPMKIKKVIFNNPATIVIWDDGSKTVVKCGENDIFDPEKGLAMAIAKKALGNKSNYYNTIKEWMPVDYVSTIDIWADETKTVIKCGDALKKMGSKK